MKETTPRLTACQRWFLGGRWTPRSGRLLLVAVACFAAFLLILLWGYLWHTLARDTRNSRDRVFKESAQAVQLYEGLVREQFYRLDQVTRLLERSVERYGSRWGLEEVLNGGLFDSRLVVRLSVFDAAGVERGTTGPAAKTEQPARDFIRVHAEQAAAGFFVGMPSRVDVPGRLTIPSSRRIDDYRGVFAGAAVSFLDAAALLDFAQQASLKPQDVLAVLDMRGEVLVHQVVGQPTPVREGFKLGGEVSSLLGRDGGTVNWAARSPSDGVDRFLVARRVQGYPLLVAIGYGESQLHAEITARRRTLLGSGVVATVLILGATMLLMLMIRRLQGMQARSWGAFQAFQAAGDMMARFSKRGDGSFVFEDINPAALAGRGLVREGVIGHTLQAVLDPETAAGRQALLETVVATGKTQSLEDTVLVNGEVRNWEIRYEPLLDSSDGKVGVLAVARDVTEYHRLLASVRLQSRAIEQSASSIVITNRQGDIEFANPAFERVSGYRLDEVLGRNPRLLKSGQNPPQLYEQLWQSIGRGQEWRGELCNRRKEGGLYWEAVSISPVRDESGEITHFIGVKEDITERRAADTQLKLAASVVANTTEGVLITDDRDRIVSVNPAFTSVTGYLPEEVIGQSPRVLSSGLQGKSFYATMWQALREHGHWRGEIWNRRKSGEFYAELLSISAVKNESGQLTHYVAVFSDITAQKESERRLQTLANYDSLTRLPNRNLLLDRLSHALDRAQRNGTEVGVMYLDLDNFKIVNDTLGHQVGDMLLTEVARRIKVALRQGDTVARLGGDEFTVLAEQAGTTALAVTAERLIGSIREPVLVAGHEVFVGASIGVAVFPRDGNDGEVLMKAADTAMYKAKEAGKNAYRFFEEAMDKEAHQRLALESGLRRAVGGKELYLVYQPQVDLKNGVQMGAEALLRWQSSTLGPVSPADFIPVAEQAGLIGEIGAWVMAEACRDVAGVVGNGLSPPKIAVNLSARQLRDRRLITQLETIFKETGVAPARLEVEITESALMEDPDAAINNLEALRILGVAVAIDDFGTGYSSLAYLRRFPLDKLKIDRAFVKDMLDNPGDVAIVEAVVAMAGALGLKVLAEGVETREQAVMLRDLGVDYAQGFYYARPGPFEALFSGPGLTV